MKDNKLSGEPTSRPVEMVFVSDGGLLGNEITYLAQFGDINIISEEFMLNEVRAAIFSELIKTWSLLRFRGITPYFSIFDAYSIASTLEEEKLMEYVRDVDDIRSARLANGLREESANSDLDMLAGDICKRIFFIVDKIDPYTGEITQVVQLKKTDMFKARDLVKAKERTLKKAKGGMQDYDLELIGRIKKLSTILDKLPHILLNTIILPLTQEESDAIKNIGRSIQLHYDTLNCSRGIVKNFEEASIEFDTNVLEWIRISKGRIERINEILAGLPVGNTLVSSGSSAIYQFAEYIKVENVNFGVKHAKVYAPFQYLVNLQISIDRGDMYENVNIIKNRLYLSHYLYGALIAEHSLGNQDAAEISIALINSLSDEQINKLISEFNNDKQRRGLTKLMVTLFGNDYDIGSRSILKRTWGNNFGHIPEVIINTEVVENARDINTAEA